SSLEELVDEDRPSLGYLGGLLDEPDELGGVLDDLHGAAAEHVGGAHEHRIADGLRGFHCLLDGEDGGARRLGDAELLEEALEEGAVLRGIDGLGAGADDGEHGTAEWFRDVDRGLAAELDDRGGWAVAVGLVLDDVAD